MVALNCKTLAKERWKNCDAIRDGEREKQSLTKIMIVGEKGSRGRETQ